MKKLLAFLLILLLTSTASATNVTRTIGDITNHYFNNNTANIDYRYINITLTPSPFEEFNFPGYLVEEIIPSGFEKINTDASWSSFSGNTLTLLRFSPSSADAAKITYSLKIPNAKGDYGFSGTFKNESRVSGVIASTTFSITSTTSSSTGWSTPLPTVTPTPTPSIIKTPQPSNTQSSVSVPSINGGNETNSSKAGGDLALDNMNYGFLFILISVILIAISVKIYLTKHGILKSFDIEVTNKKILINGEKIDLPPLVTKFELSISMSNNNDEILFVEPSLSKELKKQIEVIPSGIIPIPPNDITNITISFNTEVNFYKGKLTMRKKGTVIRDILDRFYL